MSGEKLQDLLKNADNLQQAFRELEQKEILILDYLVFGGGIVVEAKKDYLILKDIYSDFQMLHPYGSTIAYLLLDNALRDKLIAPLIDEVSKLNDFSANKN